MNEEANFRFELATEETAFKHFKASSVGIRSAGSPSDVCECCGQNAQKMLIPHWGSLQLLNSQGIVYPLLFRFIQISLIILVILQTTYGVALMLKCPRILSCFFKPDLDNEIEACIVMNSKVLHAISLMTVILAVFFKLAFQYFLIREQEKLDYKRLTASDFTIYVKQINKAFTASQIAQMFTGEVAGKHVEAMKVNRIYYFGSFVKIIEKMLSFEKKLSLLQIKEKTDSNTYRALAQKVEDLNAQLQKFLIEMKDPYYNMLYFTGDCFVSMASTLQVEHLLKAKLPGVTLLRACEPSDVMWENYGIERKEKLRNKVISYSIAALVLGVSFALLFTINWYKTHRVSDYGFVLNIALGLAASISVIVINVILNLTVRFTTDREKHQTHSGYKASLTEKLFLQMFLNGCIFILTTNLMNKPDIFGKSGLFASVTLLLLTNLFVKPLLAFIDPLFLILVLRRFLLLRKIRGTKPVFQFEASKCFENPQFDISRCFSAFFEVVNLSLFFFPVVPFAPLLAVLQLSLFYAIWKHVLIRRSSTPREYAYHFVKKMMLLMNRSILIMVLGLIFFNFYLEATFTPFIAVLTFLAPFLLFDLDVKIASYIVSLNKEVRPMEYQQECSKFVTDYDRLNPLTQQTAFMQWVKEQKGTNSTHLGFSYYGNEMGAQSQPAELGFVNSVVNLVKTKDNFAAPKVLSNISKNFDNNRTVAHPFSNVDIYQIHQMNVEKHNHKMALEHQIANEYGYVSLEEAKFISPYKTGNQNGEKTSDYTSFLRSLLDKDSVARKKLLQFLFGNHVVYRGNSYGTLR